MSTPRSLQMSGQVRSGVLVTERGSFAVLDAQPGHGVCERQPALLVPGYTGSKEDFLLVLDSLAAAGRRVVAIDMRGQYQSPPAAGRGGYAPAELAADVLAIAATISQEAPGRDDRSHVGRGYVERGYVGRGVHLVGHSLGGLVARDAALLEPDRFLSLTLLGSGPGAIAGTRAAVLREILAHLDPDGAGAGEEASIADVSAADVSAADVSAADVSAADVSASDNTASDNTAADDTAPDRARLAAAVRQLWEEHMEPQARADGTDEQIIAFLRERALTSCPVGLVTMGHHLLAWPDRTDDLAALSKGALAKTAQSKAAQSTGPPALPVMVIYGENDDAWLPAAQHRMAKRLAAERACIPAAAHSPAVEAPDTTARALTTFFNGAERRRPVPHKPA